MPCAPTPPASSAGRCTGGPAAARSSSPATHGRDQTNVAELAFDADGKILGLRVDIVGNVGAYACSPGAIIVLAIGPKVITGVYHVPDAGPARQGGADAYQHRLGVSRCRPPGGDLSHRAPDGPGGRGDEDGYGGAAPAQPDPVHRHALYHADGRDVRQRQLREHSAAHPDASRLGRLSAAARGVAQARPAARPRAVLVPGVDRCRARGDARLPRRGGRTRRRLHRDAGHGPGHRDQLRADHRRQRWTSTPRQW